MTPRVDNPPKLVRQDSATSLDSLQTPPPQLHDHHDDISSSDDDDGSFSSSGSEESSGSEDGGHHGDGNISRHVEEEYGRDGGGEEDEYGHSDEEYGQSGSDSEEYSSGEYDSDEYTTDSDEGDQEGTAGRRSGWWPFSRSSSKTTDVSAQQQQQRQQPPAVVETGVKQQDIVETSDAQAVKGEANTVTSTQDDNDAVAAASVDGKNNAEAKSAATAGSVGAAAAAVTEEQQEEDQQSTASTSFEAKNAVAVAVEETKAERAEAEAGQVESDNDESQEEVSDEEEGSSDDEDDYSEDEQEDESEDEEGQPSLTERRSLLSLAAEHDRVDIINALLSGDDMTDDASGSPTESSAQGQQGADPTLVDLLLNNKHPSPKQHHGAADDDSTFIPPLHVAISSGSTRAVAALLRLGSDPSIRPDVPRGYIPPWVESGGGGGGGGTPNNSAVGSWRKFDGMSAWELAYGQSEEAIDGHRSDGEESEDEEREPPARRSWFFGRSASATAVADDKATDAKTKKSDSSNNKRRRRKRSPLNIAPSKLEGIRHAFTAEALRSIGSDEVDRLKQLVDAGMDKRVEVGGKNLHVWADEMGAVECSKMLTERWGADDEVVEADAQEESEGGNDAAPAEQTTAEPTAAVRAKAGPASPSRAAPSTGRVPPPPPPQSAGALRRSLEESESLTPALSSMLDNLAEEVSITQGLLLTESGSKASLVSHVRSLKANKAEREDELVFWSGKLEDREWELDDRLRRIAMLGGAEERARIWRAVEERVHVKEEEEKKRSQQDLTKDASVAEQTDGEADGENEHLKATLQAELAASQTKLSQLRASIADLAEENDRNLAEVQKRGLAGAVKLARNLREELRTVEDDLREVRSAEAGLRVRVGLVSAELERMEAEKEGEARANAKAAAEALRAKQETVERSAEAPMQQEVGPTNTEATNRVAKEKGDAVPEQQREIVEEIANEEDALASDDEEFQKYVAEQADEEEEEEDDEVDDDEEEDGVLVQLPHAEEDDAVQAGSLADEKEGPSDSIKAGHSTAIVIRPAGSRGFLPTSLWDILKRIVGFGRVAAQESVEEVVDDFRQSIADVMIV